MIQDSFGNWICLKQINQNIYPCLLGQGPWNYYDKVFYKEKEIYVCRDFFQMDNSKIMQKLTFDFYQQLRTCARCIDHKHSFLVTNPEYTIFDFFTCFSKNKAEDGIIQQTAQSIKKKYKLKKQQVQIYGKKIMVLILSYIGESEQEKDKIQSNDQTRNRMLSDAFKNKTTDQSPTIQRKKIKQNMRKLDMDQVNKKQAKDKDKINEQSTLPMAYVIEMLKSIQDLLDLHSSNIFLKITELINDKIISKTYYDEIIEECNQLSQEIKQKQEQKISKEYKRKQSIFSNHTNKN